MGMTYPHPRAAPLALGSALALGSVFALGLALAGCKQDKPAAPAPSESAAPSKEPAADQTPQDWVRAHYKDMGEVTLATADVDLDGDGTPEVLAYVGGDMLCGTGGCNLVVLRRDGAELKKVSEIAVVQLPVGVLKTRSHGWRDLAVTVSGGGEQTSIRRLPYNGKSYAENATAFPETGTIGEQLIGVDAPQDPVK